MDYSILKLLRRAKTNKATTAAAGRQQRSGRAALLLVTAAVALLLWPGGPGIAAQGPQPDTATGPIVWQDVAPGSFAIRGARDVQPSKYRTLAADAAGLRAQLAAAPAEGSAAARNHPIALALPLPGGGFGRFRIEESSIMAPELAAKFPTLHTYSAQGLDDPSAGGRFD